MPDAFSSMAVVSKTKCTKVQNSHCIEQLSGCDCMFGTKTLVSYSQKQFTSREDIVGLEFILQACKVCSDNSKEPN